CLDPLPRDTLHSLAPIPNAVTIWVIYHAEDVHRLAFDAINKDIWRARDRQKPHPFFYAGLSRPGEHQQTAGDFRNPEDEASGKIPTEFGSDCVYHLEELERACVPTQLHRGSRITTGRSLSVMRANASRTSSSVAKRLWLAASRSALIIFRRENFT